MHLDEIPGLVGSAHDEWRGRLFGLNIRHVEQVGSLLAAPAGRVALERLGVPLAEVQHWLRPAIPQSLGLTLDDSRSACEQIQALLWNNERHPMGFAREELLPFRQAAFDSSLPEPRPLALAGESVAAAVDLPSEHLVCAPRNFPAPKQGQRGTCVAFTVSAMYQLMRHRQGGEPVRLSVQHLYYLAKLECPLGFDEEGTSLDVALRVLATQGCCLEQSLDYIPRHEIHQPHVVEGHKPHFSASKLGELAKSQRIGGFRHLPRNVAAIKTELRQDRPVGVGVAVYDLAWYIAAGSQQGRSHHASAGPQFESSKGARHLPRRPCDHARGVQGQRPRRRRIPSPRGRILHLPQFLGRRMGSTESQGPRIWLPALRVHRTVPCRGRGHRRLRAAAEPTSSVGRRLDDEASNEDLTKISMIAPQHALTSRPLLVWPCEKLVSKIKNDRAARRCAIKRLGPRAIAHPGTKGRLMNLAKTELPEDVVSVLRGLNIRDVETLLSLTATPAGLVAIARVLNLSEDDLRSLERRLAACHPEIEIVPAGGERYRMGHLPTRR